MKWLIRPAVITLLGALIYMWYNYIRFDNVLEFGHSHLPEFVRAENGQFSLAYLGTNLYNILCRPIRIRLDGTLDYPLFFGFLFYLVNPLFLVWGARVARELRKKRMTLPKIAAMAATLLNLFLLCMHRTFGGYQFGARYTLDLLPFAFFFLLLSGHKRPKAWECFLCGFGLLFNLYGAVVMRQAGW